MSNKEDLREEKSRTELLRDVFKDIDEGKRTIIDNLIDEAVFLEERMTELKKYPFIKSREYNGDLQTKQTAAGKQYREYLQTYTNIIDKLARIYGREEMEEESPLRTFLKGLQDK